MVEQLFGSKTRVKLLQLFYNNPNRSFYVREITRKIDEQINSVRRELANLLNVGIIKSEDTSNRLYYEVNQKYEFYKPLLEIFGSKTAVTQEDDESEDEFKILGHVDLAIMTGQFTLDQRSGVDFLLVGDINHTQLNKYIAEMEKKEGKEIRYVVMPTSEFEYRRRLNDRFLTQVLESKNQVVVDKNNLVSPQKEAPDSEDKKESSKAKSKKAAK